MRFMLFFGLVLPGVAGAACSTGTVFQQVDCLRDAVTNQKQKIDTLMYIMRSAETEFLALEQRVAVLEATSSSAVVEGDVMVTNSLELGQLDASRRSPGI